MSEFKLSSILERPLNEQHWPYLDNIIKSLNQFVMQRAKNRQYLEAQRGKQKIIEAQDEMRRRNISQISQRQQRSIQQAKLLNQQDKNRVQREWDVRNKKVQRQFNDIIEKKIEKYNIQKDKYLQQIQIALPLNNSPDRQLYHLKHQEQQSVLCGDFIEAQRIKMEIMKRQIELAKKYQRLRDSNIKNMMGDFESKHNNEILLIEARRDEKIGENEKQRQKKLKELNDKHQREMKELVWVYNEQKKKYK